MKYGRKNTMTIGVTGIYILSAFIVKSYDKTLERTGNVVYTSTTTSIHATLHELKDVKINCLFGRRRRYDVMTLSVPQSRKTAYWSP